MLKYILLAGSFVAAGVGAALGASTNSIALMSLGACPGIVLILSLMAAYGSECNA